MVEIAASGERSNTQIRMLTFAIQQETQRISTFGIVSDRRTRNGTWLGTYSITQPPLRFRALHVSFR